MSTADNRVLTTAATQPDILYFAPPASLTERECVFAEGNSERDRVGLDDAEDQSVRGPKRDELWVTPDTREALVAPYLVAWRTKRSNGWARSISPRPPGVHRERAIPTSKW